MSLDAGLTKGSKRKRNMFPSSVRLVASVMMEGSWRAESHPREPLRYRKGAKPVIPYLHQVSQALDARERPDRYMLTKRQGGFP